MEGLGTTFVAIRVGFIAFGALCCGLGSCGFYSFYLFPYSLLSTGVWVLYFVSILFSIFDAIHVGFIAFEE